MTNSTNNLEQSTREISSFLICKPFKLDINCLSRLNDMNERNESNEFLRLSLSAHSIKSSLCQENLSTECLKQLHDMWKEYKFCDLIITVNNREYLAHCLAISFHSPRLK